MAIETDSYSSNDDHAPADTSRAQTRARAARAPIRRANGCTESDVPMTISRLFLFLLFKGWRARVVELRLGVIGVEVLK